MPISILSTRVSVNTDVGVVILGGALQLLGVLIGCGATIFVQREALRASLGFDRRQKGVRLGALRQRVLSIHTCITSVRVPF